MIQMGTWLIEGEISKISIISIIEYELKTAIDFNLHSQSIIECMPSKVGVMTGSFCILAWVDHIHESHVKKGLGYNRERKHTKCQEDTFRIIKKIINKIKVCSVLLVRSLWFLLFYVLEVLGLGKINTIGSPSPDGGHITEVVEKFCIVVGTGDRAKDVYGSALVK